MKLLPIADAIQISVMGCAALTSLSGMRGKVLARLERIKPLVRVCSIIPMAR
jgi:hypothetical protein